MPSVNYVDLSSGYGRLKVVQLIFNATDNFVNCIINNKIHLKRFVYISTALVLGYNKLNISEQKTWVIKEKISFVFDGRVKHSQTIYRVLY